MKACFTTCCDVMLFKVMSFLDHSSLVKLARSYQYTSQFLRSNDKIWMELLFGKDASITFDPVDIEKYGWIATYRSSITGTTAHEASMSLRFDHTPTWECVNFEEPNSIASLLGGEQQQVEEEVQEDTTDEIQFCTGPEFEGEDEMNEEYSGPMVGVMSHNQYENRQSQRCGCH